MKLYRLKTLTSFDGLEMCEEEAPTAGAHEVSIRIRATSLNYRDIAIARNQYGVGQIQPGIIPLSDGAGDIIAVGHQVRGFAVGDRVAGIFRQNWQGGPMPLRAVPADLGGNRDGVLAQQVVLYEEGIVKLPAHLSYEEGATLPCAAVTAWRALHDGTPLLPGQTILILGSGGVSVFALQMAKRLGANVIATTSSEEKAAKLRALGADTVINYAAHGEWQHEVLAATGGIGVDRVIETGGPGTLERSLQATAMHGRVVVIGVLAGPGTINPAPILQKRLTLTGISTGSRDMFEQMNRALEQWALHPIIDTVFPFEEARAAYDYLLSGKHLGKVVISGPA
ncbi:zinc-dependent alcohol dehydrogenase family protein [Sodalis sp. RH16]|uniref:zinc-dependent alcohol dehydrogenase family protein n=1 Tax=unclassified Sodalis (in: enterobacteria) TaxID=2636512 RepID=UPI0039B5B476